MISKKLITSITKPGILFLAGITAVLFIKSFESFPIENTSLAIDWGAFWTGISTCKIQYHTYLHNPSWSLIPLLPLCWLTFKTSWGAMILITMVVLVVSIPQTDRKKWLALVFMLVFSFITIRNFADGNIEGLVIAGILILLHGYNTKNPVYLATGALLSTAKVQEVWLLLLIVAIWVIKSWPLRTWLVAISIFVAVALFSSLWVGLDWVKLMWNIPFRQSQVNMTLVAALERLEVDPKIIIFIWTILFAATLHLGIRRNYSISREKAGLLIVTSLLLSSFATANSYITVLAVGIIPLLLASLYSGIFIMVIVNLPYLTLLVGDKSTWLYSDYWTLVSLITWGVLAYQVLSNEN